MSLPSIALLFQLVVPLQGSRPVLSFPEPGLDDSAAYQGYQTRFFRDAAGNTVQIYADGRSGRVVHLWADAEDESLGFTARDARGQPATLRWAGESAQTGSSGRNRTLSYELTADAPRIYFGWFLLGSMRVERDLQYSGRHKTAFARAPFRLPEIERMLTGLERLPAPERQRQLAFLNAASVTALRARLTPAITTGESKAGWIARVVQPSLDARDTLVLELITDPRLVVARRSGDSIAVAARAGRQVPFTVRITTSGKPLTRLAREEIFNREFLDFLAAADPGTTRARWLERQVRGVELLSSREKLMAGLPAYATYFGRDMMVSALMMRSIWRDEMSEFVVAAVLRKLSPLGEVSHEEALGGQAVREAASEYASLLDAHLDALRRGNRPTAELLLARARDVLRDHRRVRENYHMIDDEFHLPVLTARWLGDPRVPADHKRAFLFDSSDGGGTRLRRLVRELALVSQMTAPYARDAVATNLVSFPQRDSTHWVSASWRDSNAGYAGGRYAMDINAIWAPHALEAIRDILGALRGLGISGDSLLIVVPELTPDAPLRGYASDSTSLARAIDAWKGAYRHFLVRLGPSEVRSHVDARLAAMPADERRYWSTVLATTKADQDSLVFLALSLDAQARPIGVANSDPATGLFLDADPRSRATRPLDVAAVMRDARLFVRPYPVGLFIDRVGPVVANDAYAPPAIWPEFERDRYHGPRVAWGREVNLFLLGAAGNVEDALDAVHRGAPDSARMAYVAELREAMTRVMSAVEASGFRSELWSYEFENGRPKPVRYGSGSDVQLWSTTDLAVQFALSRLNP